MCAQVTGQAGLPVNDLGTPFAPSVGHERARCMDQEAGCTTLDLLQPDSIGLDRRIDRRAAPTAPEALAHLRLHLHKLRCERLVGPRLVRRLLNTGLSAWEVVCGRSVVTSCLADR